MAVSQPNDSTKNAHTSNSKNEKKIEKDKIMREEFLDNASHELKTPLTQIYTAAQLLKEFDLEEDKKELINLILNGSEKLKFLLNNFLEYSKFDDKQAGDNNLEKKEQNIVSVIKNCVEELQFFINGRNHQIQLDLPEKLIIKFDKLRIEQVITNLITNAIKYTPPKGMIKISLKKKQTHIVISVKDNGIGLTKKEIKKLFKKFTVLERGKALNHDDYMAGTGLGLYLSKKIIDSHGGKIWVKSEGVNQGSTFFIELPYD